MSDEEELVEELVEEFEQEEELVEEVEQDEEVVSRAKKYGHMSKEDWVAQGRDPNQWKSPEEFDNVGKKISEQLSYLRQKVDQRDKEIAALVDYQQRTAQREYAKAKQEVEQQLQLSRDDMDVAGVEHYSKELANMQVQETKSQEQHWQQQRQETLNKFQERNKHWYNEQNPDLMQHAYMIDQDIKNRYPNLSLEDSAQMIESRMYREFPDRVGGVQKPRPNISQSSVNKTTKAVGGGKSFQSLSSELKATYEATKRIIESKGREYTQADFIARLKQDGEI